MKHSFLLFLPFRLRFGPGFLRKGFAFGLDPDFTRGVAGFVIAGSSTRTASSASAAASSASHDVCAAAPLLSS